MKYRYYILLIIGITFSITILAQDDFANREISTIATRRYPGGENGLRRFLARSARFPVSAAMDNIVGVSISSCTISPNGKIEEILIINPISRDVDNEVRRILHLTKGSWKKVEYDSTETFYFVLALQLYPIIYTYDTIKAYNLLEPVTITALSLLDPDSSNIEYSDAYIAESIAYYIKIKDYDFALKQLNETIRRNPFNPKLYQLRILVNGKLDNTEQVRSDIKKLQNFINERPLEYYLN